MWYKLHIQPDNISDGWLAIEGTPEEDIRFPHPDAMYYCPSITAAEGRNQWSCRFHANECVYSFPDNRGGVYLSYFDRTVLDKVDAKGIDDLSDEEFEDALDTFEKEMKAFHKERLHGTN